MKKHSTSYSPSSLILLCVFVMIFRYNQSIVHANQQEQTIWVISDIHHFSPSLFDSGSKFTDIQETSSGMDLRYGLERLNALVMQIEHNPPDALIVSGDLTLNGEYQSMVELAEAFAKIERAGTEVFVIPGNHDISNPWASSFMGDQTIRVQQILPDEFKVLFADYGYQEAISQDSDSLSYVAELSPNWHLFMLDSNVYSATAGIYAPKSHGQLKNKTLRWLQKELSTHSKSDKQGLSVVHHNSLDHFSSLNQGYTLDNANELQQLLSEFKLPITLSGHIHAQHISHQMFSDQFTLTDIATGAFAIYPNRIGVVTVTENSFTYKADQLDFATWVTATQQTDPNLVNYDAYLKKIFTDSARQLAEREIIAHHAYTPEEAEAVIDLFVQLNLATFSGNLKDAWSHIHTQYADLLDNLKGYGNEFFDIYIQNIEKQHQENHLHFESNW